MARRSAAHRGDPGHVLAVVGLSGAGAFLVAFVAVRQLDLVFGGTPQANAAILTGLLGGLAIGSLAGGRVALRVPSPIQLYGLLAVGSALAALATPLVIALVNQLYRGAYGALAGSPLAALAQLVLALIAAGPAMALSGATLPPAAGGLRTAEVSNPGAS